jgi:Transcriptional regulatory protein, C terminal
VRTGCGRECGLPMQFGIRDPAAREGQSPGPGGPDRARDLQAALAIPESESPSDARAARPGFRPLAGESPTGGTRGARANRKRTDWTPLQRAPLDSPLEGPLDAAAWPDATPLHWRVAAHKEFSLLRALAADPTRVFTKEELLRDVWGFRSMGRTRTLDSHASRLRRKLDPEDGRYVINHWGVGYRLIDG